MDVNYDYQVDYAKTGRAKCKKCNLPIAINSLRIAKLVNAPAFDGKIPKWFHFSCFCTNEVKIRSFFEIKDFDSIRLDDQAKISTLLHRQILPTENPSKIAIKLSIPNSICAICSQSLLKFRHMVHDPKGSGAHHHLSCFLGSSLCPADVRTLTGFRKLNKVDRQAVLMMESTSKLNHLKRSHNEPNREMSESKISKTTVVENENQNELREQSNLLWETRDKLERAVSKATLASLLEFNQQHVPSGLANLLDAVSDAMVFGALPTCSSCKNDPLHYSNGQYKCSAMATEWSACLFHTNEVERLPFRVPSEYHDVDFLKMYTYVNRTRLFASNCLPSVAGPLSDFTIFITDAPHDSGKTKEALTQEVKALGATVTLKPENGVLVLSSSMSISDGMNPTTLKKAKSLGLRIVDEALVVQLQAMPNTVTETQLTKLLKKHTISDLSITSLSVKNVGQMKSVTVGRSSSEVVRCTLKDGAIVDPDSCLQSCATVMRDSHGDMMSVVLGLVDVAKGLNSFYRLQALQSDDLLSFWVFRSWGRIGTKNVSNKLDEYPTADDVAVVFAMIFNEKTGNRWEDRAHFQKKPNKFYMMDLDYLDKAKKLMEANNSVPSKLDPAVQSLISFICDVDSLRYTMIEFDLDLCKLPLGNLSKRQIHKAYRILGNLSKLVDRCSAQPLTASDKTALVRESTRFFTLIPHNFGLKAPPLLDNRTAIRNKLQMLEDLLELEVAYNILNQDVHPILNKWDQYYKKLKTTLKPLDPHSEEFARITSYVKHNHGSTHRNFEIQVETVFEVQREDEDKQFGMYGGSQSNKMLLWHGSRRTNWMGILSQGLCIAPPEAPASGYLFGKGIYFADVASKAANYCHTNRSQPVGILLLCEVMLGNVKECLNAESSDLPTGLDSRKGLGSFTPDPSTHYTNPNDVVYPIGDPVPSGLEDTSLIYNEYIVYDEQQVRQKYLVRVKVIF